MAQKVVTCSKIDGFPLLPEITIKNEGNRVVVRKVLPRPSHAPQAQVILIILTILTILTFLPDPRGAGLHLAFQYSYVGTEQAT